MITLSLIGIGAGNAKYLTVQASDAIRACDLILIPLKGPDKSDLAELRREICADVLNNDLSRLRSFDLPKRDTSNPDYKTGVNDWHDAVTSAWCREIQSGLPDGGRVGVLVWGDPSLYDSTLRIADRLKSRMEISVEVIPGITAIQALTAGHAIPLNTINGPVTITTGRQLRDHGWPDGTETVVVMLDGACSFNALDPTGITIWWSAYAGMAQELRLSGPLGEIGPDIQATCATARAENGWIMEIYMLRKTSS